jgi:cytidyltransferase-like protein
MLSALTRRVLQTVAYTDQFSFPLTTDEVWLRLLGLASRKQVQAALDNLAKNDYLIEQKGYYYITNSKVNELVTARFNKEKTAQKYQSSIDELAKLLRLIPWVQAVAVTGSLSMGVAEPGDDLDLMIITQPNRLWLTRVIVLLIASVKGRRRYWWEDSAWQNWASQPSSNRPSLKSSEAVPVQLPKWCFNLWLTSDSLAVPAKQRSLYTAYEVMQATFIFSRLVGPKGSDSMEQHFLQANNWVRSVLPQYWIFRQKRARQQSVQSTKPTIFFQLIAKIVSPIIFLINETLYLVQVWYMRSHMTREKVSRSMAYFHPRPTQSLVFEGWRARLKVALGRAVSQPVPLTRPQQLASSFLDQLAKIHQKKQKIVLVTGVFDLLHYAHRQFLLKAKAQGEVLIVGLESDVRVRQLKGEGRPVHTQVERQRQIENLGIADLVFILPEQFSQPADHQALITTIKPQVLAVSSHSPHLDRKQAVMDLVGGQVKIVMQHDPSISTTLLLQQMK